VCVCSGDQVEFVSRLTGEDLIGWRGTFQRRQGVVIAWVDDQHHIFRYDKPSQGGYDEGEETDEAVDDLSREVEWHFITLADRDVEIEAEDSDSEIEEEKRDLNPSRKTLFSHVEPRDFNPD